MTTDPSYLESTPSVTVRGEAVLRAEPDEAMLWVTLSALEHDPGKALADVSRRSDALVAILDALGVANNDRSTTGVTVYQEDRRPPMADRPVRLDAAHEAAADAQRKAQAFAAGVGAKLGSLIRLSEPSTETRMHRSGLRPMAAAAAAGVDHMPIEPGEHEVTAAIDATFALELT